MSGEWDLKILCMGAGYVGGPTMAVIAKQCPKVRHEGSKLLDETGMPFVICMNFWTASVNNKGSGPLCWTPQPCSNDNLTLFKRQSLEISLRTEILTAHAPSSSFLLLLTDPCGRWRYF
jgi:UDP-glucose/GDP-mannose dehydrogenase family, NAD binding domain